METATNDFYQQVLKMVKRSKAMKKHNDKLALYYDLRLKDLVKEAQTTPFGGERFEALLDDLEKLEKEREEAYELPPPPIEELEAEEEPEKEELYQLNERKKKEEAFLQQRMEKELEDIKQRETGEKDKWLTARKKKKCVMAVAQFWRNNEEAIKRALEYWKEEFGVGEYKWKQTLVADLSKVDEYLLFWLRNDQPDDLAGFIVYLGQLFVYYYDHGENAPGRHLCNVSEFIALFESRFPDVFHYVYHYLFSSQQFTKCYLDSVFIGADEEYRIDCEFQEWLFGYEYLKQLHDCYTS